LISKTGANPKNMPFPDLRPSDGRQRFGKAVCGSAVKDVAASPAPTQLSRPHKAAQGEARERRQKHRVAKPEGRHKALARAAFGQPVSHI
jgi:hypothetical protein